jgi:hypothetical protein
LGDVRQRVVHVLVENKNLSNSDGEPSRPNDHAELDFSENAQLNQKPEEACIETIGLKGKMISHPERQVFLILI